MLITSSPFQVIDYPGGVILKRGLDTIVVTGKGALANVLTILTHTSGKTSTLQEICNSFAFPDRQGVENLMQELLQKKFLRSADHPSAGFKESQADILYAHFDLQHPKIIEDLSQAHILLVGVNPLSHSIYTNLCQMGIKNVAVLDDPMLRSTRYIHGGKLNEETDPGLANSIIEAKSFQQHIQVHPPQCVIACTDFGGQVLLLNWNRFCLQHQIDFLPVYLQDMVGYLGPLIIPGETACLACLRQRQNSHLKDIELRNLIEANATKGQTIVAAHPSAIGVLAHTAVFELMHFYGHMPGRRPGRLIRVNLLEGSTESKRVLKVPRCPECSKLHRTAEIHTDKMNPLRKA